MSYLQTLFKLDKFIFDVSNLSMDCQFEFDYKKKQTSESSRFLQVFVTTFNPFLRCFLVTKLCHKETASVMQFRNYIINIIIFAFVCVQWIDIF